MQSYLGNPENDITMDSQFSNSKMKAQSRTDCADTRK